MSKRIDVAAPGQAVAQFNRRHPGRPQSLQGLGGDTGSAAIAEVLP